MSNLFQSMKDLLFKKQVPDEKLLVPILIWLSGSEKNIEVCQRVNRRFFNGNRNIYIREVSLHNMVKHVIRYPKVAKDDEKTKFFYDDIQSYFKWTGRELQKNISSIDINSLKPIIATAFGYTNKERKILKLPKLELKNAKKRI